MIRLNGFRISWLLLLGLLPGGVVGSGIATDGSLGVPQTLSGPHYLIDEALGSRAGDNLFHSFERFSLEAGESARFTGSDTLRNVISRVTGGEASHLNGLLRSEVGSANFFFFNPAGLLIGPHAQLDVPAALHLSSGDYLHFSDGATFAADPQAGSQLAISRPEGFGFLASNRSELRLQQSELVLGNSDLTLSAATITLDQSSLQSSGGGLHLSAQEGLLLEQSHLESVAAEPGEIWLQGGELTLRESSVVSRASGDRTGGDIVLDSAAGVTLEQGSEVALYAHGDGPQGALRLVAGDLRLDHGSTLRADREEGAGGAAGIAITLDRHLAIHGGSAIYSATFAEGSAGPLTLRAGSLEVGEVGGERSWIISNAYAGSRGQAGAVEVTVNGELRVLHGSYIASDLYGEGDGERVRVEAGRLLIDGRGFAGFTGISSDALAGSGSAGAVEVTAGELVILEGAISSDSYGTGNAGTLSITARQLLLRGGEYYAMISSETLGSGGEGGSVRVEAEELRLEEGAYISSDSYSPGAAGSLWIEAGSLYLDGRNAPVQISSDSSAPDAGPAGAMQVFVRGAMTLVGGRVSSDTYSDADAGSVWVEAGELIVRGGMEESYISSDTLGGAGNAGAVTVFTERLELIEGAYISSDTWGAGAAGSLYVESGQLLIDGGESRAGISSDAAEGSSGDAGQVLVWVRESGQLQRQAFISSDTYGSGDAGGVELLAGRLSIDGMGEPETWISSGSYGSGSGNAGVVRLVVEGNLDLLNGARIETSSEQGGDAGDLHIQAAQLWLQGDHNPSVIGSASQQGGAAGQVTLLIDGPIFLLDQTSITTISDGGGDAGSITMEADRLRLDGSGGTVEISSKAIHQAGRSGDISITLHDEALLLGSAEISSSTDGSGDGGVILIEAESLTLDGYQGGSPHLFTDTSGDGGGGAVVIHLRGELALYDGATISSDTRAGGEGGGILLDAASLYMEGAEGPVVLSADSLGGRGDAGFLVLNIHGTTQLLGQARLSSDTHGAGRAGDILLTSGALLLRDGAGITSSSRGSALDGESLAGDAGFLLLQVDGSLRLLNGGHLSTSSESSGNAGSLYLIGQQVEISGGWITSTSEGLDGVAGGEAGNIFIEAERLLLDEQGAISIASRGSTRSGLLLRDITLEVGELRLDNGSQISAAAEQQTPAAEIHIESRDLILLERGSAITTASQDASGGAITMRGGLLFVAGSQITTSVAGFAGDGGNIEMQQRGVILDRGFIQANTRAIGASGGDIQLDSPFLLVPANQRFIAGGSERQGFDPTARISVIQAAAPDGIDGRVELAIPEIDLAADVVAVESGHPPLQELESDPCTPQAGAIPSSLALIGRGALPLDPAEGGSESIRSCIPW